MGGRGDSGRKRSGSGFLITIITALFVYAVVIYYVFIG